MHALVSTLTHGNNLSSEEIQQSSELLLSESVDDSLKADLLKALAQKGETAEEITAFVENFLLHAKDPEVDKASLRSPTIDVCGTGGDKLNLFNVSTTSMFVIAAGGATVVKHGNRGITSKSGGADVLEALGIRIDCDSTTFRECLNEAGVGFLLAPAYHPAFKAVASVRKQLAAEGIRTIFNLIGPLLNPARPDYQLVGVFDEQRVALYAEILHKLGRKQAWAVVGKTKDGEPVDEMSTMGESTIYKAYENGVHSALTITPEQYGLQRANLAELVGGEAQENATILTNILNGTDRGAKRDMVILNAAAGLCVCGMVDSLEAGILKAAALIDDGAALERLKILQRVAG